MPKKKIKEWLERYLPAEIAGTLTAIGSATMANSFYGNDVLTAYIGSLGEAIGFYLTVVIQRVLIKNKMLTNENKKISLLDLYKITISIILEFGPAGIIDGFLLRPFFLYLFPSLLKNFTLGILIGKLVGDFTFYILVILSYEIYKKKIKSTSIK